MKPESGLAALLLILFCWGALARDYRCEDSKGGTFSLSVNGDTRYEVTVETVTGQIRLEPVRRGDELRQAVTGPGDDDERYVTREMFRFNLKTGWFVYIRNRSESLFLHANCRGIDADQ